MGADRCEIPIAATSAFSVLVDNRRRSGIMSKEANLDRRFRVEAMRKFFSIRRRTR